MNLRKKITLPVVVEVEADFDGWITWETEDEGSHLIAERWNVKPILNVDNEWDDGYDGLAGNPEFSINDGCIQRVQPTPMDSIMSEMYKMKQDEREELLAHIQLHFKVQGDK